MDSILTGHTHRSSSDRLLNNYLDSQKNLTTSLLTLLSHSHTSTSSLLAYVTSSPGVLLSVRRAMKHAAFEGPISSTHDTQHGNGDTATPGWAAYVSSLEDFRRDLKQIHLLEEDMSRVRRDREILVTRLIKTTKVRPTKSDIKAMADTLAAPVSSGASVYSNHSDVSATTRDAKRANKLAEAQAELLGCEEALRGLEVRIEHERNKVMYRGLEERFRAMEAVGQMWINQARRGLADLDKVPDLPHNAYELDSNGSIAPSQSASQVGYEEAPPVAAAGTSTSAKRQSGRHALAMRAANTNGSIIEEDEGGSSDDEPQGNLVMHTNVYDNRAPENNPKPVSSPPALQEVESMSSRRGTKGRKATSDVGVLAPYSPLTRRREPLRRTVSNDHVDSRSRGSARSDAGSETSSMRRGKKRNGGFFASIARFFKGPKRQRESGRASPAPGGGWHTRTEDNIKRGSTVGRRRRGRSDSSSSDEDTRNFVAVSNIDREFGGWSAADVGRDRSTARPGMKRSGSTRSKSTAVSHSTVTARRAFSPTLPAASSTAGPSRSNTVRKAASASGEKTRKHGSIARSKGAGTANKRASQPPENIEDLAHLPPPQMPDVPKAPIAGLTPKLELARAPGSSIQPTNKANDPTLMMPSEMIAYLPRKGDDELRPSDSISRSNSRTKPSKKAEGKRRSSVNDEARNEVRPVSPLPPSKLRSPPLKSAMRPTSPSPPMSLEPPPVIDTLYSVSAPGPVNLPPAPEPEPTNVIRPKSRGSNNGDDNSVYESANEDAAAALEDSDDDDVTELGNYTVVANEKATATLEPAAPLATGPPVPATTTSDVPVLPPIPTAPLLTDDNKLGRRKSVRMNLPAEEGSPTSRIHDGPALLSEREKEHARHADAAIIAEAEASSPPRPARRRRDESPPVSREHMVWDTRIGRVRDDTSDEDDENPLTEDYARAHKSLTKNNGDFSDVVDNAKQDSKKGKKRKSLLRGKRK